MLMESERREDKLIDILGGTLLFFGHVFVQIMGLGGQMLTAFILHSKGKDYDFFGVAFVVHAVVLMGAAYWLFRVFNKQLPILISLRNYFAISGALLLLDWVTTRVALG